MKKITRAQLFRYISFGVLGSCLIIPIPLLIYSSTSDTRNFVLGNYQSYMAPKVMQSLTQQYGLSFDYYETSEDVKKLLKKNTVDISNTSSYDLIDLIQEDLVAKIDWKEFNLSGIETSNDALQLFTNATQTVLTNYKINGEPINLLDYGIPYFLQDLVFAYRGTQISALASQVEWADVMNAISNDQRFRPTSRPQMVSIDDKRTIYSIPRSIQTNPSNINPDYNASVNDIEETFKVFGNYLNQLGSNVINLNSDSNAVLNLVARSQMAGGFMFNGDAIYASYGGDDAISIMPDDFHVVKPKDTIVALDLMVINKQINDQQKISKTYRALKQICLNDGNFDHIDPTNPTLTYENFDNVNYTPTLEVLYNYTLDDYFEEWQKPIAKIENITTEQIELPINNLLKSNFNFAWIGFKNNLK